MAGSCVQCGRIPHSIMVEGKRYCASCALGADRELAKATASVAAIVERLFQRGRPSRERVIDALIDLIPDPIEAEREAIARAKSAKANAS